MHSCRGHIRQYWHFHALKDHKTHACHTIFYKEQLRKGIIYGALSHFTHSLFCISIRECTTCLRHSVYEDHLSQEFVCKSMFHYTFVAERMYQLATRSTMVICKLQHALNLYTQWEESLTKRNKTSATRPLAYTTQI